MPPDPTNPYMIDVFDRAAGVYDRLGVAYFSAFGARLAEIVAPAPGQRVLDLGCGRGAVLFPSARAVGSSGHVLGIDAAPNMVSLTAAEAVELALDPDEARPGDDC